MLRLLQEPRPAGDAGHAAPGQMPFTLDERGGGVQFYGFCLLLEFNRITVIFVSWDGYVLPCDNKINNNF